MKQFFFTFHLSHPHDIQGKVSMISVFYSHPPVGMLLKFPFYPNNTFYKIFTQNSFSLDLILEGVQIIDDGQLDRNFKLALLDSSD